MYVQSLCKKESHIKRSGMLIRNFEKNAGSLIGTKILFCGHGLKFFFTPKRY